MSRRRKGLRAVASLLVIALLLAAAPAAAEEPGIDARVDKVFSSMKAMGGAFVVAKAGKIVYERYYGVQQRSSHEPVTARTYFRCASVTKLVTGIGLMRLMERGVLDPDEDISAYLGYVVRNPRYPDTPITLRMLMSHTAGMNEESSYSRLDSRLQDMIDVSRKARANFLDVEPGTKYTYSNFGAGITGSIMECVTGKDVSSYMREDLFLPLGIDAAYNVHQLADPSCIPTTYDKEGNTVVGASYLLEQEYVAEPSPDTHYRMTVGGLYIRARDLARLGIALCGDGTLDGVRVLSEASLAMMRQEQSPETTGITASSPYSFFTIRQDTLFEGRRVYGHQGTSDGIVCNLYYEPLSQLVICVMTNGCASGRDDGVMRITRRLAEIAEEEYLAGEDVPPPAAQTDAGPVALRDFAAGALAAAEPEPDIGEGEASAQETLAAQAPAPGPETGVAAVIDAAEGNAPSPDEGAGPEPTHEAVPAPTPAFQMPALLPDVPLTVEDGMLVFE